jgi:predicted MFS family arabinose efflux permease
MTYFQTLSAAGFAATAISFGPGRMGFGLFVPEFKATFAMSDTTVGLVSGLGFLGFFVALLLSQAMLGRKGPRAPVALGLLAAATGMALVALAQGVTTLALGVFLAGSSAGFAWTPFNDAVHRKIRDFDRPTALTEISTGTSLGVALAGLAALGLIATDLSWRACWAGFAVASLIALAANWAALRDVEPGGAPRPRTAWDELCHAAALPLFAVAFVYGTTSAIYISFAPDHLRDAGGTLGLPVSATPGLVFVIYGLCGLAGLATARINAAIGLATLLRLLMLAGAGSLALVALIPGTSAGLVLSAGLQGLHVMMVSAVLASWSERLFPALPSLSFTAALLATAGGSMIGPALAGVAADALSAQMMFLAAATLPSALALLLQPPRIRERAAMLDDLDPA